MKKNVIIGFFTIITTNFLVSQDFEQRRSAGEIKIKEKIEFIKNKLEKSCFLSKKDKENIRKRLWTFERKDQIELNNAQDNLEITLYSTFKSFFLTAYNVAGSGSLKSQVYSECTTVEFDRLYHIKGLEHMNALAINYQMEPALINNLCEEINRINLKDRKLLIQQKINKLRFYNGKVPFYYGIYIELLEKKATILEELIQKHTTPFSSHEWESYALLGNGEQK